MNYTKEEWTVKTMCEALRHLIASYEFHCPEAKSESEALRLAKQALAKAEGKETK